MCVEFQTWLRKLAVTQAFRERSVRGRDLCLNVPRAVGSTIVYVLANVC